MRILAIRGQDLASLAGRFEVDLDREPLAGAGLFAIVGETGAGKTSLGYVVSRLYDVTKGRITIDGVDLRELTFASLAAAVGVVSQETYLFNATIRENLRFAKPDASDEEVEEAARAAQIHGLISNSLDAVDVRAETPYPLPGDAILHSDGPSGVARHRAAGSHAKTVDKCEGGEHEDSDRPVWQTDAGKFDEVMTEDLGHCRHSAAIADQKERKSKEEGHNRIVRVPEIGILSAHFRPACSKLRVNEGSKESDYTAYNPRSQY